MTRRLDLERAAASVVSDVNARALLHRALPNTNLEAEAQRVASDPKTLKFLETVEDGLAPFEPEDRKVVLDELIAAAAAGQDPVARLELMARLEALRGQNKRRDAAVDAENAARANHILSLDTALEQVGLMPLVLDIERRAKDLVLPEPTSASNTETLLMSYAYWLSNAIEAQEFSTEEVECALKAALFRSPALVGRVRKKLAVLAELRDPVGQELLDFGRNWLKAAYARLEVGHKLAASLCLTDIPDDVDVRAPWDAWSLVVPDGLLPSEHGQTLARIWILGTVPLFGLSNTGSIWRYQANDTKTPVEATILNLIRGACLALSNPEEFRKENRHPPSARTAKSKRSGAPDLHQARFLLSAPVKVDLREHLAGVLSGKKGASPTVQFLVRGHWRNQAHGPKHSLRKTIWVQPFWKGPEESRILLRQHHVEGPPKGA